MRKIITPLIIALFLFGGLFSSVLAEEETTATSTAQELIELLKQQVESLKAQIAELQNQIQKVAKIRKEVKTAGKEVRKTSLELKRYLREGMSGEDIEMLQEILATDPDIYPQGLVTGYFGPLTNMAVKKFQKKMRVEQVGQVGPKTLAKINQLLEEGAGKSGKVPPGLLIAPGVRKKIGYTPEPPEDQKLPCGIAKKLDMPCEAGDDGDDDTGTTTPDTTAPVISDISTTETASTSAKITWATDEEATGKVWYDTLTPVDTATTTTLMVENDALVLDHELLLENLMANTTYYFVVSSTDASDNTANSEEQSFETPAE